MKTIGITGPTGCGKTTFLQEIAAHGGVIVDCDALYYELLKTDPALKAALQKAFGNVFLPDGSLGSDLCCGSGAQCGNSRHCL